MTNKKKVVGPGRPEMPEKKRKTIVFQFRCTEQEKKIISAAAAKQGLSVSDWVRDKILKTVS